MYSPAPAVAASIASQRLWTSGPHSFVASEVATPSWPSPTPTVVPVARSPQAAPRPPQPPPQRDPSPGFSGTREVSGVIASAMGSWVAESSQEVTRRPLSSEPRVFPRSHEVNLSGAVTSAMGSWAADASQAGRHSSHLPFGGSFVAAEPGLRQSRSPSIATMSPQH
ncbi:unnamed protein product [Polarella glacialis]|nr:unnamed protein product [Polarella glacialis]